MADHDAVRGVFVNLLGNAAKYAATYGPVEVTVCREDKRVLATVADVGPGISPKDRDMVFERFFRSGDGTSAGKGGFGLGLSISRRLARDMGGDLTLADRPGGGCVFTLSLKCAQPFSFCAHP
jgi:signal transduction histidine kinase